MSHIMMQRILITLCFAMFIISCKKKELIETPLPDPVDENTIIYGAPFLNVPATEDIVMYEVNERAFSTNGDFHGIINRLDSIKAVGANVIWLMPIHPIGAIKSVNSPYSVQNYKEVNPEFGTLDDLRELVDSAHKKNMAVILDWVANHTAWDNPWIMNTSWYTQDASGNIIIPPNTNWQDVADLNYFNEEMRLAMIDAMKFWILTANIDGYRCDAADWVPSFFWKQAIDSLVSIPGRNLIFLAEGASNDHLNVGFQMNYAWDFYEGIKNVWNNGYAANSIFNIHNNEYASMPAGKRKLRFTTNHDESAWDATPMTIFDGKSGALAASVITSYLGGVPLIYGSQEVGQVATVPFFSKAPINWNQNPDMVKAYKEIYSFYNTSNALRKGTLTTFPDLSIICFKKKFDTEEVLVIVNTRPNYLTYPLPPGVAFTNWKNALNDTDVSLQQKLFLPGYQYLILKKL